MARYDAFVSYSHAGEEQIAQGLQEGVERFAKPWYRTRSLRLFLDKVGLTASPDLWSTIEGALADSRWFVLVCSPHAAESPWIEREIRWWLDHRSVETILIVVAEGELKWNPALGDFDALASTALPPALLGAFAREPHWVAVPARVDTSTDADGPDLREAIIDVATPLRGVSKERLVAAAERERRRTMRWVRGTIAVLTLLLIAAVAIGVIALQQRNTAVAQADLALSRQIASASEAATGTNLSIAMLLAVQAYRTNANAQTRAALFDADTASPKLVRFVDAGGAVKQLAGSANGRSAVAGLADGRVLRWESMEEAPEELFRLSRSPSSVAINRDGTVAAASDPSRCMLWRRGHAPVRLQVEAGLHCDSVALSPSGKTVVYHGAAPYNGPSETVTVASVDDLSQRTVHPDPIGGTPEISVPSDRNAVFATGGIVALRNLSSWRGHERDIGAGAHDYEQTVSANGRFFIVSNGSNRVPIMSTAGPSADYTPNFEVEIPLPNQTGLALSPDGSELAVIGPGEIYLAPVNPGLETQAEPEGGRSVLSGQNADLVVFANDTHLLSASGSEVAVWETDQLDRLAKAENVPLEPTCELCGSPKISISPDGNRVAIVGDNSSSGFVQSLGGPPHREPIRISSVEYPLGAPVWDGQSKLVAFPFWTSEASVLTAPKETVPRDARTWEVGDGEDEEHELAEGRAQGGQTAFLVDEMGMVFQQRLDDGEEVGASTDPSASKAGEGRASSAAISPSGRLLAISYEDGVRVEALPSRKLVNRINAVGYESVAFAGDHLLILNPDGNLQVWDEKGDARQEVIGGVSTGWLAGSPSGALAATSSTEDGTIRLFDIERGREIATFQTPIELGHLRTGLAFSPDGSRLVSVSETLGSRNLGELVSRDLSDSSLVDTACAAAGQKLTATEWRAFVGTNPPGDLSCR